MVNGGYLSHGSGPVHADRLIDSAEEVGERSECDASGESCAGKKTVVWGWGFFVGSRDFLFLFLSPNTYQNGAVLVSVRNL